MRHPFPLLPRALLAGLMLGAGQQLAGADNLTATGCAAEQATLADRLLRDLIENPASTRLLIDLEQELLRGRYPPCCPPSAVHCPVTGLTVTPAGLQLLLHLPGKRPGAAALQAGTRSVVHPGTE